MGPPVQYMGLLAWGQLGAHGSPVISGLKGSLGASTGITEEGSGFGV